MKKNVLFGALLASLLLVGCGNKGEDTKEPVKPETPTEPEIVTGLIDALPESATLVGDYDVTGVEALEKYDGKLINLEGDLTEHFVNKAADSTFALKEVKSGAKGLNRMVSGQGPAATGMKFNKENSELIFNLADNVTADYVAVTVVTWNSDPFGLALNTNTVIEKIPEESCQLVTFYYAEKDFNSLSIKSTAKVANAEGKTKDSRPILQGIKFYNA